MLSRLFRMLSTRSLSPFRFQGRERSAGISRIPGKERFGIYVHIPFCETLCSFCPYFKERYSAESMKRFLEALFREIEILGNAFPERKTVESVYFGGGSPALAGSKLAEIVATLEKFCDLPDNIGVELHPRQVDEKTIRNLKAMSCNMVSLGVQSFQPELLRTLQRAPSDERRRLRMLVEGGFTGIDVDLIFGIPDQTTLQLSDDFRLAVSLGATQISTYPFIDFTFANNGRKPQGRSAKKKMLALLVETAAQCGFERTSVWTFARKGTPRYSSVTRENFLGFGPGAATLLRNTFGINTFSVDEYCTAMNEGEKENATALSLRFTPRQRMVYWLFWSCYNLSVSRESFRELFERELDDVFRLELRLGRLLGYLAETAEGYTLTERGAIAFHHVEQHYTLQYIDRMWNAAGTVPWPDELVLS